MSGLDCTDRKEVQRAHEILRGGFLALSHSSSFCPEQFGAYISSSRLADQACSK